MKKREFLNKIWNLEHVARPAIIVEESIEPEQEDNYEIEPENEYEIQLRKALYYYHSLLKGRDDNIAALNTATSNFVVPTAFGAKARTFEDGHKYLEGPVIFDASYVDRLKMPSVLTSFLGEQIRLIQYFAEKSEGKYPIRMPDIQNPLGNAAMLWESNNFFTALLEEPQKVHGLLEMITEVTIEFIGKIKEACSSSLIPITWPPVWVPQKKGVYLADDTMSLVSPDLYEEFGVLYNNKISREFGGIMLHSCIMKKGYFKSIMKNEGLRSVNFAAQYSSDMKDIFEFFGGKVVIIPHYVHTDSPQIGTLPEFIEKVLDCWTPETPAVIFISSKPNGGFQNEVFDTLKKRLNFIKNN